MRWTRLGIVYFLVPALSFAGSGPRSTGIGFVSSGQNASLPKGSTVFDQSTIETASKGHATVFFTATNAKLFVLENSKVLVSGPNERLLIQLNRGKLGFVSDNSSKFGVTVAGAKVTSVEGRIGKGEVTLLGPDQFSVAAFDEPLLVSIDSSEVIVPAGSVYGLRVGEDPQSRQDPAGVGAPAAVRNRLLFILGGALIAAVTGIGIWLNNRGGGQAGSVVSPVIP